MSHERPVHSAARGSDDDGLDDPQRARCRQGPGGAEADVAEQLVELGRRAFAAANDREMIMSGPIVV